MKQNSSVAVLLPTNSPRAFFEFLASSIPYLTMGRSSYVFAIAFQHPWEKTKIAAALRILEQAKVDCVSILLPQESPASLFRLRNTAWNLLRPWESIDAILFLDDNMMFAEHGTKKYPGGTAERYDECMHYMRSFPQCGTIMCEGSLGGDVQKRQIRPTVTGLIATARGLFFKNAFKSLFTKQELKLEGGMEETILAYRYMAEGLFIAKQFNNPTRHLEKTMIYDNVSRLHPTNYEILHDNAEKFVRLTWKDPRWSHECRRIPNSIHKSFLVNGGDPLSFQLHCSMCGTEIRSDKYWMDFPRSLPCG